MMGLFGCTGKKAYYFYKVEDMEPYIGEVGEDRKMVFGESLDRNAKLELVLQPKTTYYYKETCRLARCGMLFLSPPQKW